MAASPRHGPPRAGAALAQDRLGHYKRYAELVGRQEAALDRDDLPLFEEIAGEIEALQQEIGMLDPDEALVPGSREIEEASLALREAIVRSVQLCARLDALRKSGAGAVRSAMKRRPQARRYVEEGGTTRSSRLDVKL